MIIVPYNPQMEYKEVSYLSAFLCQWSPTEPACLLLGSTNKSFP